MGLAWPWSKTRRVRGALAAYPPFLPPHAGKGAALTKAQRAENLAWFLESRAQRIAVLRDTMADQGYPLPAAMPDPQAIEAASLVFHRLAHEHLIGWSLAVRGLDRRRPFDPAAAGLDGFGRDIGILLGDAALALRPALHWTTGKARNMLTSGEIVIAVDTANAPALSPFEQDVMEGAVYTVYDVANTGKVFNRPNAFNTAVDLAQGRYELSRPPA